MNNISDIYDDLDQAVKNKLKKYEEMVIEANSRMNLISKSNIEQIWQRHIIDSLQIINIIKDLDIKLLDVGSGAGFPGIILSIAGVRSTALVESSSKKANFLKESALISGNKIQIINDRIESINYECDILTARAFAPLDRLFKLCAHIKPKKYFLLHKGKKYSEEIANAEKYWNFDYAVYNSVSSDEGKILKISNLSKI